ncbi:MAG: hypothetical protein KDB14_28845 [Planctomycetales bacterium]|nr:hypothetical protein [Planctomycetales bacterium]
MSKRQVLLAVGLLMCCSTAWSQDGGVTPLIGEYYFSNDHQYFAPAVWEDLGRNRKANTGWYGAISRMRVYVSRQGDETRIVGPDGGDWAWGNRVDLGYMTEADHGWAFSAYDIDPSGSGIELIRRPQLNRVNEDELDILEDPTTVAFADLLPLLDRNNQFTNTRDFDEINSFNTTKITNFEAMKSFRMPALHNGGVFEPMVGLRYMKLRDLTSDDKYLRFTLAEFNGGRDDAQPFPPNAFPGQVLPGQTFSSTPALVLDPDQIIEQLVLDDAFYLNNLFLAQVGFRLSVPHGRWKLNHELRAFCGQNWQQFTRIADTISILYDGVGDNSQIIQDELRRNRLDGNHTEFVFGSEARAEAAYHMTRDLMMNVGVQYTYLAQGIGRGNLLQRNEQDFSHLSVIFGVVYNH